MSRQSLWWPSYRVCSGPHNIIESDLHVVGLRQSVWWDSDSNHRSSCSCHDNGL